MAGISITPNGMLPTNKSVNPRIPWPDFHVQARIRVEGVVHYGERGGT